MSEQDKAKQGNSDGTHRPLPYVVRIRVALDEDRQGDVVTWNGYAYSLMEAMLQACFVVCGEASPAKVSVEHVGPDMVEYLRMVVKELHDAPR